MMRTVMLTVLIVGLCLLAGIVSAGNWTRATATGTMTTLPTDAYNTVFESFGGNQSPANESEARVNWTMFISGSLQPYTDIMGYIALVIIISLPFLLMWLMQSDMVPAAIGGIITGGFLLLFVPAEYSLLAGIFVVLAIVAVIYSLLKERM